MKWLRFWAVLAVLACASALLADNLPPALKAQAPLPPAPTLAPTRTPTFVPARMVGEATVTGTVKAEVKAEESPQPAPATAETQQQCNCSQGRQHCARKQPTKPGPVEFLANELVRKPILGIEKAANEAEGRRLCRENCRLNQDVQKLAAEAAELKVKESSPTANASLLREECQYAAKANKIAAKHAALECRQQRYCREKQRLDEKHDRLFPVRD